MPVPVLPLLLLTALAHHQDQAGRCVVSLAVAVAFLVVSPLTCDHMQSHVIPCETEEGKPPGKLQLHG